MKLLIKFVSLFLLHRGSYISAIKINKYTNQIPKKQQNYHWKIVLGYSRLSISQSNGLELDSWPLQ